MRNGHDDPFLIEFYQSFKPVKVVDAEAFNTICFFSLLSTCQIGVRRTHDWVSSLCQSGGLEKSAFSIRQTDRQTFGQTAAAEQAAGRAYS
jgi:hypothetical protein